MCIFISISADARMSREECRGMTHFAIYTAAYEPLVSVLAHEYEFAFIAAITHLNS